MSLEEIRSLQWFEIIFFSKLSINQFQYFAIHVHESIQNMWRMAKFRLSIYTTKSWFIWSDKLRFLSSQDFRIPVSGIRFPSSCSGIAPVRTEPVLPVSCFKYKMPSVFWRGIEWNFKVRLIRFNENTESHIRVSFAILNGKNSRRARGL